MRRLNLLLFRLKWARREEKPMSRERTPWFWMTVAGLVVSVWIGMCAAGQPETDSPLLKAWNAIDMRDPKAVERNPDLLAPFKLGLPEVDAFVLNRLNEYSDYRPGWRQEFDRIKAVMKANGPRACVWLIVHSREQPFRGRATSGVVAICGPDSQEDCLYQAGLLHDQSEYYWEQGPNLAPDVVYRGRMCDSAHAFLFKRLARAEKLQALAEKKGWAWAPALPPEMAYPERDVHIARLWEMLKTPEPAEYIASLPSALAAVEKSGEMPEMVKAARLILSRCGPPNLARLVGPKVPLLELLENEYQPLTENELAYRKRALSELPAAGIAQDFRSGRTPRTQGHAAWALLHREDRLEVVKAVISLYKQPQYPLDELARFDLVELMGELAREWQSKDAAATGQIIEFVRALVEDPRTHWSVREMALEILSGSSMGDKSRQVPTAPSAKYTEFVRSE